MLLASYVAKGNIFNRAIYYWQKVLGLGNYSKATHTELVINDVWYTSSNTDGGVRTKRINGRSGHWEFTSIPSTKEQDAVVTDFFNARIGKPYDYCGIICSQVLPLGVHNKDKYFCSEICHQALLRARLLPKSKPSSWFNPARLAKAVKGKYNS